MAQTVNKVDDLMSAKPRRLKRKNNTKLPSVSKYLFMIAIAAVLFVALTMGTKALQQAPSAAIQVNPEGLSTAQYQVLKQTMSQQIVSSFFTTDLQGLRDIVLGLAWVDQVSVSRDWQRGIVITALPKQAVANFGTERSVDAKGIVFVPAESSDLTQTQLATLQGEIDQAPVIMQQMQQINEWYAPLNMRVKDIILTPRMTWLVLFDNGLRVIVDNENTAQKLLSLSQLLGNQLNNRQADIQSIDLRYKNGFTIAWKIPAAQADTAAANTK